LKSVSYLIDEFSVSKGKHATEMMIINQKKTEIVSAFLNSLIKIREIDRILVLNHTPYDLFGSISCNKVSNFTYLDDVPKNDKWDLIIASSPNMHMPAELKGHPATYTAKLLVEAVDLLTKDGLLFSTVLPILLQNDDKGLRNLLTNKAAISALIDSPEGILKPITNLRLPFVILETKKSTHEFIGELIDVQQAEQLAVNFSGKTSGNSLEQGFIEAAGKFEGFSKWKASQRIHILETEYKQFNSHRLCDLLKAVNIVKVKSTFEVLPNCLYVHRAGSKAVTSDINKISSGHNNYYQCVCDEELVDADYLESFFNSKLGKLILNSLRIDSIVPSITLKALNDAQISLPPLQSQKEIANSISKLRKVRDIITQCEEDLALNPIGSDQALKKIDDMLEVVGSLADSDKVMSLIRSGESKQTEFKETLTLDVKKQTKEKYIETSAIKTIAAFMNSASGTLIVGVNDTGEICGVDNEINKFYKTHDDFLLKFRNIVKERIGGQAYDFIDYRLVKIGDKHVLLVECSDSPTPIYVDENDFYVRTNPATDKLDGPKMVTYITNHFLKK
jgi:Putative DNA-binding domain/Type I restriction modification DNA specificity domain